MAFAAPRQRGKGDHSAAIQKVKPRGVEMPGPDRVEEPGGWARAGLVGRAEGGGGPAGLAGGCGNLSRGAAPEWVAEGANCSPLAGLGAPQAPSYGHKSPSNRRPFLWGWGGVRGRRVRPAAAAARGRAVFRGPRPRDPRVAPELLGVAPPRAVRRPLQVDPAAVPGVGLGEVGALLALGARLQTPAELGSSAEQGMLRETSAGLRGGRGAPLDFGVLGSASPSGSTPDRFTAAAPSVGAEAAVVSMVPACLQGA